MSNLTTDRVAPAITAPVAPHVEIAAPGSEVRVAAAVADKDGGAPAAPRAARPSAPAGLQPPTAPGVSRGRAPVVSPAGLVEEIYTLRTTRDSRGKPGEFCAPEKTGFTAFAEDRYRAWTFQTSPLDGRVIDPQQSEIGQLQGCVGNTQDPDVVNFYMRGNVGTIKDVSFAGTCRFNGRNTPETGASPMSCTLTPTTEGYVGGQAVTNTMAAPSPAYQTPSFMTLRLWRKAGEGDK